MKRFFSPVIPIRGSSSSSNATSTNVASTSQSADVLPQNQSGPSVDVLPLQSGSITPLGIVEYVSDPGLRPKISSYDPNERENIRRLYLQKGPCQPRNHIYPWTILPGQRRRFNKAWFDEYNEWLEYSITKDALFCLPCYLFKSDCGDQGGGYSFVTEGFRTWKKKGRLDIHVGAFNSIHNQCVRAAEDLMKQNQHIEVCISRQSEQSRADYRIRLTASLHCIRFLMQQGLSYRGHDESESSYNKGNFLELFKFLGTHNEEYNRVIQRNAPENLKLISHCFATEVTNSIICEIGDGLFSILVDETRDISVKEQLAIVVRFVDERGFIIERFLGLVHVKQTNALSLKEAIDDMFAKHGLSIASLRGQGYDGASNMNGEFNGLKSLILRENKSAFYVHCFAHHLQLTLIAVAENHPKVDSFFEILGILMNVVGVSCKRRDLLRDKQYENVILRISGCELPTGRGLNQETTLKRPGDTRWGSHYGTILSLINMFYSVVGVLHVIGEDGEAKKHRNQADNLLERIQSFEFVFILHLMKRVLEKANDLSQTLHRKDQDIVNAMTLVRIAKLQLQTMRDDGWEDLVEEVYSFCSQHRIVVPEMEDVYVVSGRLRRNPEEATNHHYYRFSLFNAVVDSQLSELNDRFNEVNTELLICMSCLDPSDSFSAFDKFKLRRFAQFYPSDFDVDDVSQLGAQLDTYILDMRSNAYFSEVVGVSGLARKLVQSKKHRTYGLVYKLIELALLLPVATVSVERVFSAMKIIKTQLRNRMGDEFMNDTLIGYIEKDVLQGVSNEDVIQRFQNMKLRRGVL